MSILVRLGNLAKWLGHLLTAVIAYGAVNGSLLNPQASYHFSQSVFAWFLLAAPAYVIAYLLGAFSPRPLTPEEYAELARKNQQ